ncbi:GNAT family N-acetyltransferase [Stappia sp. F7233]|uniref:GNAT family N-acetyltransferase n=1 Tax=Stappia albiluteola TaxID=2758565 RepID=A0A839AFB0_9HYPH|nr:GNAT family protein [Stappia albiluteola]MBA5778393.1 GNAT family N-acetyltransferase [Stappia albiluteola]
MVFLRSVGFPERESILAGRRIYLRAPAAHDYVPWAALREESRSFLKPWEPRWPEDDLSRASFRRRLRRYAREMREDKAYPFFLFKADDGCLVGGATLSNIRRGVAQSCSLGYWMGAPFAGQGFMSEAVRLLVPHAFSRLRLHRVEAACLPHNAASITLLQNAGFQREGYARRYLCIDGRWEDHVLFARISDDPDPDLIPAEALNAEDPGSGIREKEAL